MSMELFYKLPQDLAARKDLTGSDKVLYAVIITRMGSNGRSWPGIKALMRDCGLCRDTVLKSIRRLEAAGILAVNRRGIGKVNHYTESFESGLEIRPVRKSDRSENQTIGGLKTRPEAVRKSDPNKNRSIEKINIDIPEKLNCEVFLTAWKEWITYRGERRKALTPTTIKHQFQMLAAHDLETAVKMIMTSIQNGWTGIFPPKTEVRSTTNARKSDNAKCQTTREIPYARADEPLPRL